MLMKKTKGQKHYTVTTIAGNLLAFIYFMQIIFIIQSGIIAAKRAIEKYVTELLRLSVDI